MKNSFLLVASSVILATGCSGSGSNSASAGDSAYNDVATGARLMGLNLNGQTSGGERLALLTDCSAALSSHAGQSPPPPRAEQLRTLADHLQQIAISVGAANGKTAADVNHMRDEAMAAQRHLAASNASAYASALAQAVDKCSLGEIMTDEELSGSGATAGNAAPPVSGALNMQ